MNRKTALILIILIATTLPMAWATESYVSIQESEDDVWMTEAGNVFGYQASVQMLDGEIGIRSFLRFENVSLLKSSKINLAQLRVYAGFDQGDSPSSGAKVTVYGIAEADCTPFSYSGQVWSLERPLTSASVNWDLETWAYSSWHTVNVTDIVKEIINQYPWEQNNSLGFQILGASDTGYAVRTFEDIDHQHHGAHAILYIQYDVPPGIPPSGIPGTAILVETYGDYDIWTSLEYENFYEDWTEVDPLNLIATTEANPYRVTFTDFGYEEYWDDLTYFKRDVSLNTTADNIEVRFKATLTAEDVPYNRPDFQWVHLVSGAYSVQLQHHVGGVGADEDHFFTLGADAMSYGFDTLLFNDPIPPVRTGWFSFLWDYDLKQLTMRQFSTDPNSSGAWYTDFIAEANESGVDIDQKRYTDVYAPRSRLGSDFYLGLNWGYLEHMAILVDFVPVSNETVYYVVDENGTIIWTDVAPDVGWVEKYIDDYVDPQGGDPLDPAPGTGWEETGPFTRFRMRLYFLMIGVACIFVPIWAISYKRPGPQGVAWCCMLILIGLGLLISIPNI